MRKFILIAGFVLGSAAAQAGDNRSLSLAGSGEQTTATAPAAKATTVSQAAEAPRAAEVPQATEAPKADAPKTEAPKYVERPAIVEPKPDRYRDEPRYKEEPRYKDEPRYSDSRRPNDDGPRYDKPRNKRYWTERRIINTLHRHGIYW